MKQRNGIEEEKQPGPAGLRRINRVATPPEKRSILSGFTLPVLCEQRATTEACSHFLTTGNQSCEVFLFHPFFSLQGQILLPPCTGLQKDMGIGCRGDTPGDSATLSSWSIAPWCFSTANNSCLESILQLYIHKTQSTLQRQNMFILTVQRRKLRHRPVK